MSPQNLGPGDAGSVEPMLVLGLVIGGLSIVAFMATIFICRNSMTGIGRGTYIAGYGALSVAMLLVPALIAILRPGPDEDGLTVLPVALGIVLLVTMVAYARMSLARAQDAFGRAAPAMLALVPLLNFVLWLRSTRHDGRRHQYRIPDWLAGGQGVITGFMLIILSIVAARALELRIEQDMMRERSAAVDTRSDTAPRTLEVLLAGTAAAERSILPLRVNETTVLVDSRVEGLRLSRVYQLDRDYVVEINMETAAIIDSQYCDDADSLSLLRRGVQFEEVFIDSAGIETGRHTVRANHCSDRP
ncbi:MAG: hypothetical protein VYB54_06535 [Pseudomonadota bacterium]|nr:hypothetical protein [Pseudomonadota bacterium]